MNWACELSTNAERVLRGLPKAIQRRVARVLTQMSADPFQGNLRALRGPEWKGVFRKRIGDYRVLFIVDDAKKTITIQQISLRSGKTYR